MAGLLDIFGGGQGGLMDDPQALEALKAYILQANQPSMNPRDPSLRERAVDWTAGALDTIGMDPYPARRAATNFWGGSPDQTNLPMGMGVADVFGLSAPMDVQEGVGAVRAGAETGEIGTGLMGGAQIAGGALSAIPGVAVAGKATKGLMEALPGGARLVADEAGKVKVPGSGRGTKNIKLPSGKKVPRPKRSTEIPSLRGMPAEQAVALARQEPHLIASGAAGEGAYVGGPRSVQNYRQLQAQRKVLDDMIARGEMGGDWYDRYRKGVKEVTGGEPRDELWFTNLEGQYSAGVSPEGELGFALKDTNATIATGDPGKPARPAQAAASRRAIAENDPYKIQLGKKTGEYARQVNPARLDDVPTATGVNDFRHARNLGYTEASGEAQRNAVGAAGHNFMDYETALAVDRANARGLGGRSDWTGEQIQAAPWVSQKADDLYQRGEKQYLQKAQAYAAQTGDNRPLEEIGWELAFGDANKTIVDFFPKHTAYGTHEARPYVNSGHLPDLQTAGKEAQDAYAMDPRSTWATAPGGRDAIYGGMRHGNTGYAVRTLPTTEMQGVYTPQGGATEYNMGAVARPLVAFDATPGGKALPQADRDILTSGEALRGMIDVQGAGAAHKNWPAKDVKGTTGVGLMRPEGRATPDELGLMSDITGKYGFPDVVDTGQGMTATRFYPEPEPMTPAARRNMLKEIDQAFGGRDAKVTPVKVDAVYVDYEDAWKAGEGSDAVVTRFFDTVDKMPEAMREALDNNPYVPERAAARLERDAELSGKYGLARKDVQTLRGIIAEGPGWMARLRDAMGKGILPAGAGYAIMDATSSDRSDAE